MVIYILYIKHTLDKIHNLGKLKDQNHSFPSNRAKFSSWPLTCTAIHAVLCPFQPSESWILPCTASKLPDNMVLSPFHPPLLLTLLDPVSGVSKESEQGFSGPRATDGASRSYVFVSKRVQSQQQLLLCFASGLSDLFFPSIGHLKSQWGAQAGLGQLWTLA